jgi:hypothetical protein
MRPGGQRSEGVGDPYRGAGRGSGSGVVGSSRVVTVITSRCCNSSAQETSLLEPEATQEGHQARVWRDLRDCRRRIHFLSSTAPKAAVEATRTRASCNGERAWVANSRGRAGRQRMASWSSARVVTTMICHGQHHQAGRGSWAQHGTSHPPAGPDTPGQNREVAGAEPGVPYRAATRPRPATRTSTSPPFWLSRQAGARAGRSSPRTRTIRLLVAQDTDHRPSGDRSPRPPLRELRRSGDSTGQAGVQPASELRLVQCPAGRALPQAPSAAGGELTQVQHEVGLGVQDIAAPRSKLSPPKPPNVPTLIQMGRVAP